MIGKVLKYMRNEKKLKQVDLAKRIGVGNSTVSQYETENRQATFDMIEKIANECGYQIYFESDDQRFCASDLRRKDLWLVMF